MKKQLSLVSVFLVFLAMGFGDAAGQLVSIVEKAFNITPLAASLGHDYVWCLVGADGRHPVPHRKEENVDYRFDTLFVRCRIADYGL